MDDVHAVGFREVRLPICVVQGTVGPHHGGRVAAAHHAKERRKPSGVAGGGLGGLGIAVLGFALFLFLALLLFSEGGRRRAHEEE